MTHLGTALDPVLVVLTLAVLPVVLQEFHELCPWLANKLIERAAKFLPPPDRALYEAEWKAELSSVPGKLMKLLRAVGLVFAAIRMRRPLQHPGQARVRTQDPAFHIHFRMELRAEATVSLQRPQALVALLLACFLVLGSLWFRERAVPQRPQLEGAVVAFSPDGKIAAVSDYRRDVVLWDVTDGSHPRRIGTLASPTDSVFALAFSPDGHTLAAGGRGPITLWDVVELPRPRLIAAMISANLGSVNEVAFSPDGRILAVESADATARWDLLDPLAPRLFA